MKYINIFLTLLFCTIVFQTSIAQNNDTKAKAAYLSAEDAYQRGEFTEAVTFLNTAKELLGNTNAKIQYLMVKALKNGKRYEEAKTALTKYFELAQDNNQDEKYQEMIQLITVIKNEAIRLEEERIAFDKLKVSEDLNEINAFVQKYTNSPFQKEVMNIKKEVSTRLYKQAETELTTKLSHTTTKIRGNRLLMFLGMLEMTSATFLFIIHAYKEDIREYNQTTGQYTYTSQVKTSDLVLDASGFLLGVMLSSIGGRKVKKWNAEKKDIEFQQMHLKERYFSVAPKINIQNGGQLGLAFHYTF